MFHYIDNITDSLGTARPGWRVRLAASGTSSYATIYSDRAGALPVNGSVLTADDFGAVSCYVVDGRYDVLYFDKTDTLQFTKFDVDMYSTPLPTLAGTAGASLIGVSGGGTVQDQLTNNSAAESSAAAAAASATSATTQASNAAASATAAASSALSASASAATATTQAGAVAAALNSSNAPYPNAYASTLPLGVTSTTITAAGTGGTAGTYALGVSSGPTGFAGTYTISGGGVTAITITNPGLSTSSTAPTLSFPSGSVTGATATATVSTLIADQKTYWVASSDSSQILLYGNNGGSVATAPFGGTQLAIYGKAGVDAVIAGVTGLITTTAVPDPTEVIAFGQDGGAKVANFDALGLMSLFFGMKSLPFAADDGSIRSTVTAFADELSGVKFGIADATTRAALFAIYTDGTMYPSPTLVRPDLENIARLRALRSGLTFLKLGGSTLVHVIFDGDSWWDGKAYGSTDAITRFYAESGLTNAGPGWIGLASGVGGGTAFHGTALNNITVSRTGTWTDLFRSANTTPGTPQNFPGYDAAQSGADGSIYTITGSTVANCTSLTLFCGKGGGIEQSWDGTTWNAVTVTAGSGSTTATIDMTGKSNSLRLRCTNGTVVAGLFGLTASSGVVFSNLSNSGSTATQKASVQSNADYRAMMAALPGDTITALIQLGLNDTKAGTANETIVTNVATVAAGYKAIFTGFPSCGVGILCQPNTPLSVQDTLAPLLRAWAYANDAMFFDWQNSFGRPASAGDYAGYARDYTSGATSTALPLLEVSTGYRHPSPTTGLTGASKSAALTGAGVVASGLSNILLSPLRSN